MRVRKKAVDTKTSDVSTVLLLSASATLLAKQMDYQWILAAARPAPQVGLFESADMEAAGGEKARIGPIDYH
jgi:hypothetical protein